MKRDSTTGQQLTSYFSSPHKTHKHFHSSAIFLFSIDQVDPFVFSSQQQCHRIFSVY